MDSGVLAAQLSTARETFMLPALSDYTVTSAQFVRLPHPHGRTGRVSSVIRRIEEKSDDSAAEDGGVRRMGAAGGAGGTGGGGGGAAAPPAPSRRLTRSGAPERPRLDPRHSPAARPPSGPPPPPPSASSPRLRRSRSIPASAAAARLGRDGHRGMLNAIVQAARQRREAVEAVDAARRNAAASRIGGFFRSRSAALDDRDELQQHEAASRLGRFFRNRWGGYEDAESGAAGECSAKSACSTCGTRSARTITLVVEKEAADIVPAECVVCLSSPASDIFAPCGHKATCGPCAKHLSGSSMPLHRRRCPLCRERILAVVSRVYTLQ